MIKYPSRHLLPKFLHESGFLRLFVASQRNKITILMLHGVIDPKTPAAWKPLRSQLSTEQLTRALSVLASYYHFVSLSEAVEMLAGTRPLVPNSLALTFDDGYRNNLTFALPVLRRFNAPATIFLSTGNVTSQKPFWFDRLDYAVQLMADDKISRHGIPELAEIDFSSRETLSHSFIAFIRKERQRYTTDTDLRLAMEGLTERMEQCSGHGLAEIFADDPWSGVLTWDEVRQAATEVHFGSHGVNHPLLSRVSPDVARQELVTSRKAIELYTGRPCIHLAYPDGSFNHEVVSMARACGYSSAVTIIPGLNQPENEMLTLRRIAFPRKNSHAEIIAAVSGLSSQWQKLSQTIHLLICGANSKETK